MPNSSLEFLNSEEGYLHKDISPDLVLQLQGHVERIHSRVTRIEVVPSCRATVALEIAIPVVRRDPGIVPRDDIIDARFPFIPVIAVERIHAGIPHIGLESADADLVRNQVQRVHGPRMPVEDAETGRATRVRRPLAVIRKEPLEFRIKRKYARIVRQHLFKQQVHG